MKRITSIVLFASIFAVAVGTLGLSGNSATLMISAAAQTPEEVGMLGHVEYKLMDEFGDIKAYMQNDNVVVQDGKDCAAQNIFTNSQGQVGNCIADTAAFTFIGIGNGSSNNNFSVLNRTLADGLDGATGNDPTGDCSDDNAGVGTTNGGEMARRNVTASFTFPANNAVVELNTSGAPFTFDASNATAVIDSGIFNADFETLDTAANDNCNGSTVNGKETGGVAGTHWNMFSRQLLNNAAGITVGAGDSLSVKWTITVG